MLGQLVLALHMIAIDQIEEKQAKQRKKANRQRRADMPQLGHNRRTKIGYGRNLGEHLLIGQPVNNSTGQKTQKPRDQIIQLAFAGPGDTCTRSVTADGHAKAKNEAPYQVPRNVSGGHIGEGNNPHPLKRI